MDRKEFIKTACFACFGGALVATLMESCGSANYFAKTTVANNKLALKKAEFLQTTDSKTTHRKFVLIKTDKYHFPICVFRFDDEKFSALLLECTHKGCELVPNGDYLICPCHGSEFSNLGVVQNPPAEKNLQQFDITTDHEKIYIHI